jgi:hypothetical protein
MLNVSTPEEQLAMGQAVLGYEPPSLLPPEFVVRRRWPFAPPVSDNRSYIPTQAILKSNTASDFSPVFGFYDRVIGEPIPAFHSSIRSSLHGCGPNTSEVIQPIDYFESFPLSRTF